MVHAAPRLLGGRRLGRRRGVGRPGLVGRGAYVNIAAQPIYYDYGYERRVPERQRLRDGADAGSATSTPAGRGHRRPGPGGRPAADGEVAVARRLRAGAGRREESNTIFQLAVDHVGHIRGNYYDGLMDQATPVAGAVDKKSQRACWTIGDKKTTVFETGVFNLTKQQTPVLVHFGNDRTQQVAACADGEGEGGELTREPNLKKIPDGATYRA